MNIAVQYFKTGEGTKRMVLDSKKFTCNLIVYEENSAFAHKSQQQMLERVKAHMVSEHGVRPDLIKKITLVC